jgi:gluconolactonase
LGIHQLMRLSTILSSLLLSAPILLSQVPASTQTVAEDIPGIVKAGTKIELVKSGLAGSDDPIGLPDGTTLFTEPPVNRIWKIDPTGQISVFRENSNGGLGMSVDSKGHLFSVQSAFGHAGIAVIYPPGSERVVVDNFEGMSFGRPNDLIVDKKGGVYFTDPGLNGAQAEAVKKTLGGKPLPPRLPPAVYYVPADGKAIKVVDGIERPNGITLSRDEKTLFLNNTNGLYMLRFDVNPDGTLRNRRNFAVYEGRSKRPNDIPGSIVTGADGLIIDNEGRLYALTAAGVEIFSPQGKHLGIIRMSCNDQDCQGLGFSGPKKSTLYVAGRGGVWKIEMLSTGFKGRAK